MKKLRIGIVGRVADGVDLYDGQTVATRIIRNEIESRLQIKTCCVDTYNYKRNVVPCVVKTIRCIFTCDHIFVLLSENGLSVFLPLLYYAKKIFHCKVYHRIIGNIAELVNQHPKWVKYLNALDINLAEGRSHVDALKAFGVENVVETYNFRNAPIVSSEEYPKYTEPPFRFCTFSRVTKAKGISDALNAITQINAEGKWRAELDIYGPLDEAYKPELDALLQQANGAARYMGCVPSETSVSILKEYFMHLFPTTWKGEGISGTLVECFAAGLPTIATDWNYNAEVLTEGRTGFCYDWKHPERLKELMVFCIEHPAHVAQMRYECATEAMRHHPDQCMRQIFSYMGIAEDEHKV